MSCETNISPYRRVTLNMERARQRRRKSITNISNPCFHCHSTHSQGYSTHDRKVNCQLFPHSPQLHSSVHYIEYIHKYELYIKISSFFVLHMSLTALVYASLRRNWCSLKVLGRNLCSQVLPSIAKVVWLTACVGSNRFKPVNLQILRRQLQ